MTKATQEHLLDVPIESTAACHSILTLLSSLLTISGKLPVAMLRLSADSACGVISADSACGVVSALLTGHPRCTNVCLLASLSLSSLSEFWLANSRQCFPVAGHMAPKD